MSFADEIKNIRVNSYMSQNDFAKALGVAFSTVNRWEMGRAIPGYKAMKAINDFCAEHGIDYDARVLRKAEEKENG